MARRISFVLVLLSAAAVFAVVATGGDQKRPPPPTHTPAEQAEFGVAGPDGEIVVCANGRELRVPRKSLFAPPSYDPTRGEPPPPNATEEMVWRCGVGEHPDRNPRLVPISQDPLRQPSAGS